MNLEFVLKMIDRVWLLEIKVSNSMEMAHLLREASFRHSPHPLEGKVIRVDVLV